MQRIVVVGGGASGMMAALTAAEQGAEVTLLEKMEKPGKKLLVTGNGRCNLTNLKLDSSCFHSSQPGFVEAVLERFSVRECRGLFVRIGLPTRVRDNYVYPYTEQASSALEVLQTALKRLRVKVKCNQNVTAISRSDVGWEVRTATWTYPCDRVILAAGSKAAPKTGSDGGGYLLAESAGHRINPVLPALVPLKIASNFTKTLAGVRSKVRLQLRSGEYQSDTYSGELQWSESGISGIVVFQVSAAAARALAGGQQPRVTIDLFPDYREEELAALVLSWLVARGSGTLAELLTGLFNRKVLQALLQQLGLKAGEPAGEAELRRIISLAKQLELTVSGTKSFDAAQVCSGGVELTEIDPETMASKLAEGLYITGELLDADGICGGYNLHWAWSTGYLAGTAAAGAGKGIL